MNSVRFGSVYVVDARHLGTAEAIQLKSEMAASYPNPASINAATPKSVAFLLQDPGHRLRGDKVERIYFATVEDKNDAHFEAIASKHHARALKVEPYEPDMRTGQHLDRAGGLSIADVFADALRGEERLKRLAPLGKALEKIGNFLNPTP